MPELKLRDLMNKHQWKKETVEILTYDFVDTDSIEYSSYKREDWQLLNTDCEMKKYDKVCEVYGNVPIYSFWIEDKKLVIVLDKCMGWLIDERWNTSESRLIGYE